MQPRRTARQSLPRGRHNENTPYSIPPQLSYGDPDGGSYPDLDGLHEPPFASLSSDTDSLGQVESVLLLPDPTVSFPAARTSPPLPSDESDVPYQSEEDDHSSSDLNMNLTEFPSSDSEGAAPLYGKKSLKTRKQPDPTQDDAQEYSETPVIYNNISGRGTKRTRGGLSKRNGRPSKRSKKAKTQEQTVEFKRLNAIVTDAWLNEDYDTALSNALEAVKLDPEIFPLHATIAEILVTKGRKQDAIGALFTGVQTSKSAENWWYVVDRINILGQNVTEERKKLIYCYTSILRLDPSSKPARLARLKLNFQRKSYKRARADCLAILQLDPDHSETLKYLAEVSVIVNEIDIASRIIQKYFDRQLAKGASAENAENWGLLSTYIDLLVEADEIELALDKLNTLSRWLLGRRSETFWNDIDDDCEWDVEDRPRRLLVKSYTPSKFPPHTYGLGLPVELRLGLGRLRVLQGSQYVKEAINHFNLLLPEEESDTSHLEEYAEAINEAADTLRENGLYAEALRFYELLRGVSESMDSGFFFDLAICYQALGQPDKVREAVQGMKHDDNSATTQVGLAKLYRSQGRLDLMWRVCGQLKRAGKFDLVRQAGLPTVRPEGVEPSKSEKYINANGRGPYKRREPRTEAHIKQQQIKESVVRAMYDGILALAENEETIAFDSEQWLNLASELFDEFHKDVRLSDRDRSMGTIETQKLAENNGQSGGFTANGSKARFMLLTYDEWRDFLTEYALRLAHHRQPDRANEVLDITARASLIWDTPQSHQKLRSSSLGCAILLNDENRLYQDLRWFSRSYPFSVDSTVLTTASYRAIHQQASVYTTGPEQKFALRQVKFMDSAILSKDPKQAHIKRKSTYLTGGAAKEYQPDTHEAPLLIQYGHFMLGGSAPLAALNYYFRAFILRPHDALLNFCIGMSYITLALKRQSSNRQYQVQQGLHFVREYYKMRQQSEKLVMMQEAEFNMAMTWHSLGLFHLALPCYRRCLEIGEQTELCNDGNHNFTAEAAMAIRSIMALNGDFVTALEVTRKYMVL